jgi:hypothetical protein
VRQSQKTEQQADRLSRIGLENRKYTRARSTDYGEGKGMSVTIQDLVLDRNNLNQAYLRVKRNKGAAGIDDMTVNDLLPYLRENKTELIASLREGKYKPAPVKRVEIPKPNGGVRKLGIPTVVDRMVQQAVAQILTPIFERVFSDNSFGFRPHRGAHDAIEKVVDLYNQGYRRVVDQTLITYFMQSSMMVTSQSLANLGAVLANDGIKPWDNERLISHEDNELVKKLLTTVGSFEESKEYTIKIELPIKSGTGGGLLACAPQKCGIGIFSPALDQHGNSLAGMSLLQDVVDQLD